MTETRELVEYKHKGEWNGYSLKERPDGLWILDGWTGVQGCMSGRKAVIEPPSGWTVRDEADMDTRSESGDFTKAEKLVSFGREVHCLRRGHVVR